MRDPVTLFCLIYKQKTKTAFAVQIDKTETLDVLKQHIVRKNRHYFGRIDPQRLCLYKVSIKSGNENCPPYGPFNELQPTWTVGRAFPTEPPEEEIHILAKAVQTEENKASRQLAEAEKKKTSQKRAEAEKKALQKRGQAEVARAIQQAQARVQALLSKRQPQPQISVVIEDPQDSEPVKSIARARAPKRKPQITVEIDDSDGSEAQASKRKPQITVDIDDSDDDSEPVRSFTRARGSRRKPQIFVESEEVQTHVIEQDPQISVKSEEAPTEAVEWDPQIAVKSGEAQTQVEQDPQIAVKSEEAQTQIFELDPQIVVKREPVDFPVFAGSHYLALKREGVEPAEGLL